MSTLMTSFIAIVLLGLAIMATVSYVDPVSMRAGTDGIAVAERLQTAAHLATEIKTDTGSYPRSRQEMIDAGMPTTQAGGAGSIELSCGDASCSTLSICSLLENSEANMAVAAAASDKVNGSISGTCGAQDAPGERVVVSLKI